MRLASLILSIAAMSTLLTSTGCVSLEAHEHVRMDNRKLKAEKEQLQQELFDARAVTGSLRDRSDSLDQQLGTKDQMIANLKRENDGLERKFNQCQDIAKGIIDMPIPTITLEAPLPEELDSALKVFADQHPRLVVYNREHGTIKWTSDLLFPLGSDVVKQSAASSVAQFAEIMKLSAAANFDVFVVGHTDNVPIRRAETLQQHPTNWHLSAHRAIAVAKLLQQNGLGNSRVGVVGFGENRPLVSNDTKENRTLNRRVEMYIKPSGSFAIGAQTGVQASALTGQGE